LEEDSEVLRRVLELPVVTSVDASTPLDALFFRCVLQPLLDQVALVDRAGAALFLYGPVRLMDHLGAIRRVVLLEEDGPLHPPNPAIQSLLYPPWPLSDVVTKEVAHGCVP
jgi:hypothetical protein